MSISKKQRRKIVVNERVFWWCVKPDDDTYQGLIFSVEHGIHSESENTLLSIISDDKKFIVSYHLNQKNPQSKIKNQYIIVEGKEFKGLDNLGHCCKRFITPDWDTKAITPALVAQIIDWCFTDESVIKVDYNGDIVRE